MISIRQYISRFFTSWLVIYPLRFYRFASSARLFATIRYYFGYGSVTDTPKARQLSVTHQLPKVPILKGLADIHTFERFHSFYHFLRKTFFHNRYILVKGKDTKPYKGKVYNLSVWQDESYITQVGITHNCRCSVVQTAEKVSAHIPETVPDVKPEFEINVGKTGQVFNEDSKSGHRFFALARNSPNWEKRFELSKLEAGFNTVKTPKGNKVKESIYADDRIDELQPNRDMAVWATDTFGYKVEILPKLDGKIIKKVANPEYRIDGNILADRKAPKSSDYSKSLSRANKQGCKIVFFELSRNNDNIDNALESIVKLLKKTNKGLPNYPIIEEIYVCSGDKSDFRYYKRKKQP